MTLEIIKLKCTTIKRGIKLSFFDYKAEDDPDADFRYYMGRHKVVIADGKGKKVIIKHLEKGYVGNKKAGYKEVGYPMWDIVLTRHCRHKRRD